MDSRYLKHFLSSAATGSFLLLSASPTFAGRMFRDQPTRPHVSAASADNWGYNQTCWQRFPALPPCDGGAGCGLNVGMSYPQYEQSGAIYAPQSGLILPDQFPSQMPSSSVPQNFGGMRYEPSSPRDSSFGNSGGSQLMLPPSSDLQMPPSISSPGAMMSPSLPMPTPVPMPSSALPPLPSPPSSVPAIPNQTSVLPNRLMFGPDGRIMAAPMQHAPVPHSSMQPVSTSSRYGKPSNPTLSSIQMPSTMPAPSALPMPASGRAMSNGGGSSYRSEGVPVQFANRTNSSTPTTQTSSRYGQPSQASLPVAAPSNPTSPVGVPVQSISLSRPVAGTSGGSRYGAGHSGNSMPAANQTPGHGNLEPLRSTPRVPYQR